MKYIYSIAIFLLIAFSSAAQQGNNVAFGEYGGLNFSNGSPSVFRSAVIHNNGITSSMTTTMSDCEGNIVFYSNGDSVWNKNHEAMDGGVLSTSTSVTSWARFPVLSFPYPDSSGLYFLIYANSTNKCYYAIIDMNQNGGLGKVVSKGNYIEDVYARSTDIIPHANGKDFWFITKGTETEIYAYPITKNGFGNPVKSSGIGRAGRTTIKASSFGNKIALSVDQYSASAISKYPYPVYVYDFNLSTGIFSNPLPVLSWSEIIRSEILDLQFSPNDSLLYLTNYSLNSGVVIDRKLLIQVDLYSLNPVFFNTKLINERYEGKINSYSMFLGPDNKIYMAEGYDTNRIAIIHNPNIYGKGCSVQRGAIDITPASTGAKFGTVYQPIHDIDFNTNARDRICTDTASFLITGDTTPFSHYVLYYGDGDSSFLYNSKRETTHTYLSEGKYLVKLKAYTKDCNFPIWRSDSVTVRFAPKALFITDSIGMACGKRQYFFRDSSIGADSFAFSWNTTLIAQNTKGSVFDVVVDSNATYSLTHTVKNDWGCTDTFTQNLTVTIAQYPKKGFAIDGKDSAGCTNHTITLYDSAKKSTQTIFYWGDGDSLITTSPGNVVAQYQRVYFNSGIFKPYQVVSNTDGCKDTFYYPNAIRVVDKAKAGFTVQVDSTCDNITITLSDTSVFADSIRYTSPFVFSGKAKDIAQQLFTVNGDYTLTQKVWNGYCADSVSISIPLYKKQHPDIGLFSDKLSGCLPLSVSFTDDSTKVAIKNSLLDFGNGQQVISPLPVASVPYQYNVAGTYKVMLSDTSQNGCFSSDSVIIEVYPKPSANVVTSVKQNCGSLSLNLKPNAQNASLYSIVWGDGSSVQNVPLVDSILHTYPSRLNASDTSYTVRLILTNANTCADTFFISQSVLAHNTLAAPQMLGVSVTGSDEITLQWQGVTNAKEYKIDAGTNGVNFSTTIQPPQPSFIQGYIDNSKPTDKLSGYYRVSAVDSCAISSPYTPIHKTVLLTAVEDDDKAVIEWTPYEVWQGGVLEYSLEYWDKTKSNPIPSYTSLNSYTAANTLVNDDSFENSSGDERCYRVIAKENGGNNYQSSSNVVCLQLKPTIIIPNAFTPNGDGLNDYFTPTVTSVRVMTMTIYNRYGELIYSETSAQPKWDGTYKEELVTTGNYLVMIGAIGNNKRKINYSGYVYLLR